MISRPRLYSPLSPLRAREGQAVVCPLLRGSSPTRWVAPKQHWGLGRAFSPAISGWRDPPWRGGAEESGAAKFWFIGFGGAILLDRIGPPGRCSGCRSPAVPSPNCDLMISRPRL